MASMRAESGIGLELYQYKVALVLIENLDTAIDYQQSLWVDRDAEWNTLTGQDPTYVEVEYIKPENVFRGHRPSLIDAPPQEKFPNISVMAYIGRPGNPTNIIDQASNYNITIDIETAVKGESEAEVDARKHRTVEAIQQVLTSAEGLSLDGMSQGWENDPIVIITDIYKRKAQGSYGDDWYWQMARLRYVAQRHSMLPDNNIDQI